MPSLDSLKEKWGLPFVKDGIDKNDKAGSGQIKALNMYFDKHPVQVMELSRILAGNEITISFPSYFNGLMRWEANWILGRVVPYFTKKKQTKKSKPQLIPKTTSISAKQSTLKASGKLDYYEYIASDEWKEKSRLAKERAGNRCQICYRSSAQSVLHTHHRTYKRLGHELDSDLTVLCAGCHKLYEDNKKSPKYY